MISPALLGGVGVRAKGIIKRPVRQDGPWIHHIALQGRGAPGREPAKALLSNDCHTNGQDG